MKIHFKKSVRTRYFYFSSCLLRGTGYGYRIPSITFVLIDTISNYGLWSKKERMHIKDILKEINAKK